MSSYQKRRISEQTYKFPKCIFSIFFLNTRYIFILCTMSLQLELRLLLEHKIFPENVMCREGRGGRVEEALVWAQQRGKKTERKMKRGRLGKAKKNQYVSDKKAQILDVSSVWVSRFLHKHRVIFYSSLPILKDLWGTSYVFNSWQKRKQNEGIFSSLEGKLNWKFSIIYIWGQSFFDSSLASLIRPFTEEISAQLWWRRSWGGWSKEEWQFCVAINSLNTLWKKFLPPAFFFLD